MRQPLLYAVLAALLGFGGWVWLTGPGTSVPNAFIALLCGVLCGRAGWWLALRVMPENRVAEPTSAEAAPPPSTRRAPPPVDRTPWRRPDGTT
ncbi:hypothetical protein [Muricoccus aerilatus]|uniref:hypothetical protein n=1 Tax=Muricoccus aerilatus TaxID=452982 RepID=UPI0005C201E1|nr:hypothetical protein [Roseomonas aerilata]